MVLVEGKLLETGDTKDSFGRRHALVCHSFTRGISPCCVSPLVVGFFFFVLEYWRFFVCFFFNKRCPNFLLQFLRFAQAGLLKRRGSWQLSNGEVERPRTFPLGLNYKHCGGGRHVFVHGQRLFSRLMSEGKLGVPRASPGTRIFKFYVTCASQVPRRVATPMNAAGTVIFGAPENVVFRWGESLLVEHLENLGHL